MNTILPKFLDFNNKTAFYKTNSSYTNSLFGIVMSICAIIIILCVWVLISIHSDEYTKFSNYISNYIKAHNLKFLLRSILRIMICTGVVILVCLMSKNIRDTENMSKYYTHGFHITNTNLMASKYQVTSTDDNDDISSNLDPHKNYHISKYHVYVDLINAKPKGMHSKYVINQTPVDAPMVQTIYGGWFGGTHINNDNKYSIIYLGYMKNGKFIPNYGNMKITKIFMDYQDYIKKHHLESKFKHHFSFEVSHNYTTKDHDPVLVVIGDNGFILHYKNDKITKDSDIVQERYNDTKY